MVYRETKLRDEFMDLLFSEEDMEAARRWFLNNPASEGPGLHAYYIGRNKRILKAAEFCLERYPGDLAEIGCYSGASTRPLAGLAEEYGRRMIAVDPWIVDPKAHCHEDTYEKWQLNTKPVAHVIDEVRQKSQSEEAIAYLKSRQLAFVYVDGLHNYEAAYTDYLTVSHCNGIIAADDINWPRPDMWRALWDAARITGREIVWYPNCVEGYLLPIKSPET